MKLIISNQNWLFLTKGEHFIADWCVFSSEWQALLCWNLSITPAALAAMLLEAFKVLTCSMTNQLTFAEYCFLHLEYSYLILNVRAALQYMANAAAGNEGEDCC